MKNGHWVTIDGNHVFIEDSKEGRVLKGRIEKHPSDDDLNRRKDRDNNVHSKGKGGGHSDNSRHGNGKHRSNDGGGPEDSKDKVIETIGNSILKALSVIGNIAANIHPANRNGSSSSIKANKKINDEFASKIKPFKSNIDLALSKSKAVLSKEKADIIAMQENILNMHNGDAKNQQIQKFNTRKDSFDKVNSIVHRIDAFNTHQMYPEMAKEVDKLDKAVKQLPANQGATRNNQNTKIHQQTNSVLSDLNLLKPNAPRDKMLANIGAKVGSMLPKPFPEASKLWLDSTSFLKNIKNEPNTQIYKSIDDIKNLYIKGYLKNKVKGAINKDDCRGVVFNSDSSISKAIDESQALKNFLNANKNELLKGGVIDNASIGFTQKQDFDLYYAIHKADVLMPHLDKDGNFHAIIGDVYDFDLNKNNPQKTGEIVKKAINIQQHGKLENYFILIFVDIDKSTIKKYFNVTNHR